jgi:hypothetical protein
VWRLGASRNSERQSWGFLGPIAIPRPRPLIIADHHVEALRGGLFSGDQGESRASIKMRV